ncbi:hypothetical protein B0T26DRAFT_234306 [Lasiosphaeria miniovina]|uniref:Zn(2)-C6 fungal-type domain-containing protein n=1 Tax=Lasiosphaeria miniovina TaxID=1954250 RepID=A0AA40AVI6_9PEZI|nr:uncharacterized protein B0T26DRAFT_234306 [Lasiosphaeria miniovina]KAK0722800.1 hypothetical protein B0T26DRAFT_234306 [Lasiosphaeria miniovina]
MVYCGKASLGCQSCRTRRIKCDKVRPHCTQCVRVGKQCPGYRDQLSLMFRDESTKVIQKAHAQWGVAESPETGESSDLSPASASSSASSNGSRAWTLDRARHESLPPPDGHIVFLANMHREIDATKIDKAVQFYIERYVIGLPDEPKVGQELQGKKWAHTPEVRDIMAAVGLASMSNLTGNKELYILAREQYGLALRHMALSIRNSRGALDLEVAMRMVVMLALFEMIRGRAQPVTATARTHLMGGAALLKSVLPFIKSPADGVRGLLQMCFSMLASVQGSLQQLSTEPNVLIPTQASLSTTEGLLPSTFFDWISAGGSLNSTPDRPAAELINMVTRFVQLSISVRSRSFGDGQPKTTKMITELLDLDGQLEAWEHGQEGVWGFAEKKADAGFFPPEAVLDGCYHVYKDMWAARVWNHYRWARIMSSQMLLESVGRFPKSSLLLVSAAQQQLSLDAIARVARDSLVSTPTHYRHPGLERAHCEYFDQTKGGAGIGAAGIPTLLFQIKVAGAAPGVTHRHRAWALAMLETIWANSGMFQAKALAEMLYKVTDEHLVKEEPE